MPDIVFTPDRHPIDAVRVVPASPQFTAGRHPVRAVRIIDGPGGDVFTPAGFPVRAVRLVDAAGNYTASQTPITTQPEDMFTPNGMPIEHVCIIAGAVSPEVVWTVDGRPIEAVRLCDAAGNVVASTPEAETLSWQASVVTNGGTVSAGRLNVVNAFIVAEKAAGTWDLTDDYWPLWGENAAQALTSLKQRRLATAVAAPIFTADRGYAGDGTTSYINTGFVPSTHAVGMTNTNMRLAAYYRANQQDQGFHGSFITSTSNLRIRSRSTGNQMRSELNSSGMVADGITNSSGFKVASRASTVFAMYSNGVPVTINTAANPQTDILPNQAVFILNQSGPAPTFVVTQTGFACIGASLTPAQEAAQYANVQAWATAIGAQV